MLLEFGHSMNLNACFCLRCLLVLVLNVSRSYVMFIMFLNLSMFGRDCPLDSLHSMDTRLHWLLFLEQAYLSPPSIWYKASKVKWLPFPHFHGTGIRYFYWNKAAIVHFFSDRDTYNSMYKCMCLWWLCLFYGNMFYTVLYVTYSTLFVSHVMSFCTSYMSCRGQLWIALPGLATHPVTLHHFSWCI